MKFSSKCTNVGWLLDFPILFYTIIGILLPNSSNSNSKYFSLFFFSLKWDICSFSSNTFCKLLKYASFFLYFSLSVSIPSLLNALSRTFPDMILILFLRLSNKFLLLYSSLFFSCCNRL